METKDISDLIGIPNVVLSKDGRLWRDGKEKKFTINVIGYPVVTFYLNGKGKTFYLHQLLLKAFVRMPNKGEECLHRNGIRSDFRLENLSWGTRKDNVADAIKHGTATIGANNGAAIFTNEEVQIIRRVKQNHKPFNRVLANLLDVSQNVIQRIVNNRTYRNA